MIFKGIAATTKLDAHNMKISKATLEEVAQNIESGGYALSVGVEHDHTIMPIGKVYSAYVDKFDEKDYALYIEQEIFDKAVSIVVDGEQFVIYKSEVDNRPFAFDELLSNDKLKIITDPVNFENHERVAEYLDSLAAEFDIDVDYQFRKSVIPDPELIFELVESSIKYYFIYMSSKKAIEKIGDATIDSVMKELGKLYAIIKKAIRQGVSYLLPHNRPVTCVFKGNIDYIIELIIKTTNPDVAIRAISGDELTEVFERLKDIKTRFQTLQKVQFIYDEVEKKWELNYLTTETGEVIGTEKSHQRAAKLIDLHLGSSNKASVSLSGLG